jgi:hypothetical protein
MLVLHLTSKENPIKFPSRYRWFVVAVFFAFMLLHQADNSLFFAVAAYLVPEDIALLREQMHQRAEHERVLRVSQPTIS